MNATIDAPVAAAAQTPALESSIEVALSRIPPLWPLAHFVAVNPFVGLVKQPFAEACSILQRANGAAPLQAPLDYLAAFRDGTIQPGDLKAVSDAEWFPERLTDILECADDISSGDSIATVADTLDQQRPHSHWSVFIVEEISKWCGVAYDQNQTSWNSPWQTLGVFAAWRQAAVYDHNPEAFGLAGFRAFIAALPQAPDDCIQHCMALLAPPNIAAADFLHRQLATISGWAGYVQYLVREDEMRGKKTRRCGNCSPSGWLTTPPCLTPSAATASFARIGGGGPLPLTTGTC